MTGFKNKLMEDLHIRYPLVMAPMFLVTNETMLRQCIESGILGCFPSLNYRKEDELNNVLSSLNKLLAGRQGEPGNYAVNLIVQRSNIFFEKHQIGRAHV